MQAIDLRGKWVLSERAEKTTYEISIPGDIQGALLDAGIIEDPYYGKNENDVQWVHKREWTIEKEFSVDKSFIDNRNAYLSMTEVDTFATVEINGAVILETNNQFRRWRKNISSVLVEGVNKIKLTFAPVEEKIKEAEGKSGLIMPDFLPMLKVKGIHNIRKVQCHGGWDWGVVLSTIGVYGELQIDSVEKARLEYVYTTQNHGENRCELEVTAEIFSYVNEEEEISFNFNNEIITEKASLVKGENKISVTFSINNPKLWYPSGYGEQNLYNLTIDLSGQSISKKLGLRTLEVITEKDDIGNPMTFRVNGIDIFCKGACWIPVDGFSSRHTKDTYEQLLKDAIAANMNMIRVWGGGQYEKEFFYDLCDELGILVWQDYMFACSQYPGSGDFLDNVKKEVEYQTKRLRDRASVALFCGDNEVVMTLNWEAFKDNRDHYVANYDRLNQAIGSVSKTNDPTRTFWPSSPCSGNDVFESDAHNPQSGDMHYWKVWHGGQSFDSYYKVQPRFCSEFGYQSFPTFDTVKKYIDEEQWNLTSPQMEHHQRNEGGNSKILEMFSRYFRMPNGFKNSLWLSQLQQSIAMKTGVEYWRATKPVCMGTLYWQLNDNWPVASWSSIEYGGAWKQMHYHAKRFFAPVIVVPYLKEDTITVAVTSDVQEELSGTLKLSYYDLDGTVLKTNEQNITVPVSAAMNVVEFNINDFKYERDECFMVAEISLKGTTQTYEHTNEIFFTEYKQYNFKDVNIETEVGEDDYGIFVTLKTDKPAAYVTVNFSEIHGVFSDNSFVLVPGHTKKVYFENRSDKAFAEFKDKLEVMHLKASY